MTQDAPPAAPEWARRFATEIRRRPLRWFEGASHRSSEQVHASGWFLGTEECATVLGAGAPRPAETAAAFGAEWPVFSDGGVLVAPALPVALESAPVEEVDAEYEAGPGGVWREAAGARRLFIDLGDHHQPPGRPFDLLWFGADERYVLHRGEVEIEDLFARVRLPAPANLLQRLLVRGRRLPEEMLDGLPTASDPAPAELEIERPAALCADGRWRDPERFLSSRADVQSASRTGSEIVIESVHGESTVFEVEASTDRWVLKLSRGAYHLTRIALALDGDSLRLSATLDDAIDPLAPGMRGRLVFDLRADLVAMDSHGGSLGSAAT